MIKVELPKNLHEAVLKELLEYRRKLLIKGD